MSKLDDVAADLPVSRKVSSKPMVTKSDDAEMARLAENKTIPAVQSMDLDSSSHNKKALKRKQSKIRLDSEDEESDNEPLTKRNKMPTVESESSNVKDEPETLLKLESTSTGKTQKPVSPTTSTQQSKSRMLNSKGSGGTEMRKTSNPDSDSDSDAPLQKSQAKDTKSSTNGKESKNVKAESEHETSSSEECLKPVKRKSFTNKKVQSTPEAQKRTSKQKVRPPGGDSSSEDEKPLKKSIKKSTKKENESSDDEKPLKKRVKQTTKVAKVPAKDVEKVAKRVDGKKTKAAVKEEGADDDDGEEQYRWWEHEKEDNSVKWTSLQHNGVVFPDAYQPLPKDVKMKYNGKPLELTAEAEEVAGFFGALIETDHAQNPIFVKNFFQDFQIVCKNSGMSPDSIPSDFARCDFKPMFQYFEARKEEKKAMSKEEKKRLKEEKDAFEEKYKEAIVDGRKEKIGNFRIEPPGLFRGRGAHPKTGRLKTRVQPEQVTINIGEDVPVPAPPEGHKWAEVKHDNTVTWLATWNENINNNVKYVMMAAGSSFKGQSDLKKYEKARTLKGCIKDIRKKYEAELSDKVMETRQRATAMYFIDKFALRAGNEKGEDEADTVGCCSLRLEHVSLQQPQTVIFDFLGKDSIRYYNEVTVDKQVFKNLMIFKKGKSPEDMIFDRLNTLKLNKHLTELMPGLSAKVFRTFNASFTFQEQLKQTPADASVADKVLAYNRANREVAILCNHQRTVSKTHDAAMEKIEDKVKEQKYQKMRLHRAMVDIEPKLAKKKPSLLEYESDIDDEWIAQHHEVLYNREVERIKKKFAKENEKLLANDEKALPESELKDRLKSAEELKEQLKQEKKSKKVTAKSGQTVEKLEAQVKKLDERIAVTKTQMIDKDENKTTALGTSKINYIDPRLTFAWCAKYEVPIEKMFTKTLREKFLWAAETPADWIF